MTAWGQAPEKAATQPSGEAGRGAAAPSGLFTTMRVERGRGVRRRFHRARLSHDAALLARAGAPLADALGPVEGLRLEALLDRALEAADRAAAGLGEGMVRVLLEAQGGALGLRVEAGPARRVAWRPGDPPLRLLVRPDPRPPSGPFVKALDRAAFAPLEAEARAAGFDGVLLEGPEGLREGTWFHIALRVGGVWRFPAVGQGVLYGTTRAAFLETLRARGEAALEEPVPRALLEHCDGLLVLSSLLEVAPAAQVDAVRIRVFEPLRLSIG